MKTDARLLSTMDKYPNLSTEYEEPEACRECGSELKKETFVDVTHHIQEELICDGCGYTETTT